MRVLMLVTLVCALVGCGSGSSNDDGDATTGSPTVVTASDGTAGRAANGTSPATDDSVASEGMTAREPETSTPVDVGSFESGPEVEACALLTAAEVESVLGGPALSEPEDMEPLFYGCRWETEQSILTVDVISHGDPEQARSSFDMYLGDVTVVDGIGDAALSNIMVDLAFITGGYEVTIGLIREADDEADRADARELAALLIPRLP